MSKRNIDEVDDVRITYHDNGIAHEIYHYVNDKKHGSGEVHFYNGAISQITNWKDDKLHGDVEYRNIEGEIIYKGQYINGNKHGNFISFNEIGYMINANWNMGVLHGEYYKYYNNKKLIGIRGNYKNGEKDGEFIGYRMDGKIKEIVNFKNGKKDGKEIQYFTNETIHTKSIYKNGELIKFKELDKNGILIESSFVDLLNNTKINKKYYSNGKIKEETTWLGKDITIYREYFENGAIKTLRRCNPDGIYRNEIAHWPNGKLKIEEKDNIVKTYYENGEKDEEYNLDLTSKMRNGPYNKYYDNGKPHIICKYSNNKIIGLYVECDKNGEIIKIVEYFDDREIKIIYDKSSPPIFKTVQFSGFGSGAHPF